MSNEFILNGKTYTPEVCAYGCEGCAGEFNNDLCEILPRCEEDVVFIEVTPE